MAAVRYYVLVVPGLERVAWKEIRTKLEGVERIAEERGRLIFRYSGDPRNLLFLRSVENAYAFIRHMRGITRSRKSLGDIFKLVRSADVQSAMEIHKRANRAKGKKRLTFRVVSSMLSRHNFRRIDMQQAVEKSLIGKYGWRINLQNPILEFRIDLEDEEAIFGLRITDESVRQRNYKISHLPASLKPTVAYCMVSLSDPSPTDVFVDPMCGAGTIPIERAMFGQYASIIAGDMDEEVIGVAQSNVETSKSNIELKVWNVSSMPLENRSVDKIVCNLPFGKKIGSRAQNQKLYANFFREMTRILKPGGKAVLLTSERELINKLINKYRSLNLQRYVHIDLLGIKACIYVIDS